MTTENQTREARASGRIPLPLDYFPDDLEGEYNYWILTIDGGFTKPMRGNDVGVFLVFREGPQDDQGERLAQFDMRLSTSDEITLRRIYGERREWLGQWVVVEARCQGKSGDGFGEGRRYARIAPPAKWRKLLPEVVPLFNRKGL